MAHITVGTGMRAMGIQDGSRRRREALAKDPHPDQAQLGDMLISDPIPRLYIPGIAIPAYGIYDSYEEAKDSKLPMQKITGVLDPRDIRDRLLAYWTTVSITCALLATISGTTFSYPPDFNMFRGENATQIPDIKIRVYALLHGTSFALVFIGVIMSSIYFAILNQLPTNESVLRFIDKYSKVLPLPTTCLIVGATLYLAAILYGCALLYGMDNWGLWASTAILGIPYALLMALWVSMQMFSLDEINKALSDKNVAMVKWKAMETQNEIEPRNSLRTAAHHTSSMHVGTPFVQNRLFLPEAMELSQFSSLKTDEGPRLDSKSLPVSGFSI